MEKVLIAVLEETVVEAETSLVTVESWKGAGMFEVELECKIVRLVTKKFAELVVDVAFAIAYGTNGVVSCADEFVSEWLSVVFDVVALSVETTVCVIASIEIALNKSTKLINPFMLKSNSNVFSLKFKYNSPKRQLSQKTLTVKAWFDLFYYISLQSPSHFTMVAFI